MDNEVRSSVHLAIQLMVVAFTLGVLIFFAIPAQNFKRAQVDSIADTQAETYATELVEAAAYGPIPASSAFIILERNVDAIHSISGSVSTKDVYGQDIVVPITGSADLTKLFHTKVRLGITPYLQMYDVTVKEE
ncbi:hypothetical protein B5M42_000815 [Paenibacillus athensensis]|uniref:Uncharacterized protein n=1 Tax=Paenibacillus athensensis TaxID=1967502 RepID=A0A4Y8Q865_9BACL|nr:hypothetical protein [Paenibacillus athensensis]MCD1257376.1 hypothetical protein [Paenibacillus athensensis]